MDTVNHSTPAKIGIVLPYFGTLPNYFPVFLESCRRNPTVDWLLYTDCDTAYDYPENVKVHRLTFESFRDRLQKSYDFPIGLQSPYKLCDFKPTYGDTLRDDLTGYDFWGHCDCDMVFGNIRKFITQEITDRYDRILNCGHLILYRNIPEVNTYYRTQSYIDYQTVLGDTKNHSFDEWPGISQCWRQDGKPCYGELCYDDVITGMEDFRPCQQIPGGFVGPYHAQPGEISRFRKMKNVLYSFSNGTLERCWVQNGLVHREETLYLHLQKRKMLVDNSLKGQALCEFFVVPNRFLSPAPLTVETLKTLAPKSTSAATKQNILMLTAQVILYELKGIGKPDFKSRSAVVSLLNPKK